MNNLKPGMLGRLGLVSGIVTSNGLMLLQENFDLSPMSYLFLVSLILVAFGLYVADPNNGGNNEH